MEKSNIPSKRLCVGHMAWWRLIVCLRVENDFPGGETKYMFSPPQLEVKTERVYVAFVIN